MIKDIIKLCSLAISLVLLVLGMILLFFSGASVGVGVLIGVGVVLVFVAGILFQMPKKRVPKTVQMAKQKAEESRKKRLKAAESAVSVKPREGYATNYDEVFNKKPKKAHAKKASNKNICPYCKYKKNWPSDNFCQHCGSPLK